MRRDRHRTRSRSMWFPGLVFVAVILFAATVALTILKPAFNPVRPRSSKSAPSTDRAYSLAGGSALSTTASMPVEVPALVGMTLREARIVLKAAGLRAVSTPGAALASSVTTQSPPPGAVEQPGSRVSIFVEGGIGDEPKKRLLVVCLDPGHQQHADTTPEPVRPGSRVPKPSVSAGTSGVRTGLHEYEIALQIAMNVKRRLELAGVRVVMTRTTNDVNISNGERAKIANKAKADLFVRIHGNGSPNPKDAGVSTLYPAKRKWSKRISAPSQRAARTIQSALVASTGAIDLGVAGRDDLAGFNFASVPSVLVECGFLSNPIEDRLLASPHYQDSLSEGISQGVLAFLAQEE